MGVLGFAKRDKQRATTVHGRNQQKQHNVNLMNIHK
jgi:hypothetical protein